MSKRLGIQHPISSADLDRALSREWLVTNRIGGYASGTVAGANTRTYHGLLVASLPPPWGRQVLLAKVDEELKIGRRTYQLGVNEYWDGTIHPDGYRYIQSFESDLGIPVFMYFAGGVSIRRKIWMEHGENTVCVMYTVLRAPKEFTLSIRPFCAFRSYHGEQTSGHKPFDTLVHNDTRAVEVSLDKYPHRLVMSLAGQGNFTQAGDWYNRFLYRVERERGLPCLEDLYTPGIFQIKLHEGDEITLLAACKSTCQTEAKDDVSFHIPDSEREISRRKALVEGAASDFERKLMISASQFIVNMPERDGWRQCILAGYHWFTDWGRDTMIAFPGLLYASKDFAPLRLMLTHAADSAREGMLPNRINEDGVPEYNTADASLWFFEAARKYMDITGDHEILQLILPGMRKIIEGHLKGTGFGIKVDPSDGLLHAGEPGTQLTWMDACVDGKPVTPRAGKPVEINALWYNALMLFSKWCGEIGVADSGAGAAAMKCLESFERRFCNESAACLFDVVDGLDGGNDSSIRPNQIIAISLPNSPLSPTWQKTVVDTVEKYLYTPYGLRTLSPEDRRYRGRYEGGKAEQDNAYHQGTVWPWLLGPFADAHYRVYRDKVYIADIMEPFVSHMEEAGIGSISEVFDGDPPQRPSGCVAQAWSVCVLLRICREYRIS